MQQIVNLTLSLRVISKKNSKRVMGSRFGKKMIVLPSVAYGQFQSDAIAELRQQIYSNDVLRKLLPITRQVQIDTSFQIKGKYQVDADNLHTSILDVLMAANVIDDDNQVVSGSYSKTTGADEWFTLIRIIIL